MAPPAVAEVAVPFPVQGSFHYRVPSQLTSVTVGHAVTVPFGNRPVTGYVIGLLDEEPAGGPALKELRALEPAEPLFTDDLVPLARWISRYYSYPLGLCLKTALPTMLRRSTTLYASLTEAGRRAVVDRAAVLDPPVGALLDKLAELRSGSEAWPKLQRGGCTEAEGKRAVERGWIELRARQRDQGPRVRREEVYTLQVDPMAARGVFPRPGPVRDRLIDWLHRQGSAGRAELKDAFPRFERPLRQLRDRDLVAVTHREIELDAADRVLILEEDRQPRDPNDDQRRALERVHAALDVSSYQPFLLHGVTGSGKTEVYLQAASRVIEQGGGAIFLVPEIGLTPQFLSRFRARLGERLVGVLHSRLTPRERLDEWLRIRRGEARVVVGPRSAVFAPVPDLRLIVVDEEHDSSYKQEDGLRYHARDVALVRARTCEAVALLGSATPSLESLHNARSGRYELLSLPRRVSRRPLPDVELVDLRDQPSESPDSPLAALSRPLREALEDNQQAAGQTILLLNRRGFATTILCTDCGQSLRCPSCDVSLTYHGRRHEVLCHYCGRATPLPTRCPGCGSRDGLQLGGRGTERLEEELRAVWPDLRVDRMDADTTRSRAAHRRILDAFRQRRFEVLVGTQMVAKGHDFPGVTLVGVLAADAALHLPDFRASERTFQLIAQVAGRAGRGDRPGRVVVQAWFPDHHAVRLALEHDFLAFAERELRLRRGLGYPPFSRLLMVRVDAIDERQAKDAADALGAASHRAVQRASAPGLVVRGPHPAPLYKLRDRFRWQLLVRGPEPGSISRWIHALGDPTAALPRDSRARVVLDRDPVSML